MVENVRKTETTQETQRRQERAWAAEVQHRVRNLLAVVRMIARRTGENARSVEDYQIRFDGRLAALARVQALIGYSLSGTVDLAGLLAEELRVHGARDGERALIDGPPVTLNGQLALSLGLALHELTTNAVKFGALSAPKGTVSVSWTLSGEGDGALLHLVWKEHGAHVEAPTARGFGWETLEQSLPYELDADVSLHFEPDGVRCIVVAPLALRDGG